MQSNASSWLYHDDLCSDQYVRYVADGTLARTVGASLTTDSYILVYEVVKGVGQKTDYEIALELQEQEVRNSRQERVEEAPADDGCVQM